MKKYILIATGSIFLATMLSGCMMMGMMNKKDGGGGGMMKCGMMMGGGGMDHSAKDDDSKAMKCGSDMDMDKKDHSTKEPEDNSKAYVITKQYCTQCHGMRNKSMHTVNEWRPILARMMNYMQRTGNNVPDTYEASMIDHYYGIGE